MDVTVGDVGEIARFRLGEITASINLGAQLGPVAGLAEFDDSRATARDIAWIALAGPLVSCVAAALTAVVMVQIPAEGIAHWLRSDGRLALGALKVVRELR